MSVINNYHIILKRACFALSLLFIADSMHAQLSFSDATETPIEISPTANSGLDGIYVLDNTLGVKASVPVEGVAADAKVYIFSNLGAAYAQQIESSSLIRGTVTFSLQSGDMGYVVESSTGRSKYYWVTDYSHHLYDVTGVSVLDAESDCDRLALKLHGSAPVINYYTINGRPVEIPRDIQVSYNTLVFDETVYAYNQQTGEHTVAHAGVDGVVRVPSPLCATEFTVTGDRFLIAWGQPVVHSTHTVNPMAVEAHTKAEATEHDAPNEKTEEGSEALGGSGPCEVTFTAAVTDGAEFHQWQIARDEEFDLIDLQYSDLDFTYTFREQGYSYVRFVAADASGNCEYYGDTYTVYIGDSRLECPNAFSPGASEGVNDEWRVSYKSIIDFHCAIFNRWGVQVATLTHPSQGWDGRYKGKLVPAGVYFYVIEARGADDRKYKLSGDINVIRYKGYDSPAAPEEPAEE